MFNKPSANNVKAINSISRKFSLTQDQLKNYYAGLKQGRQENALLAEMLAAPLGADPFQYLNSFLTPQELTTLKQALYDIAPRSIRKTHSEDN